MSLFPKKVEYPFNNLILHYKHFLHTFIYGYFYWKTNFCSDIKGTAWVKYTFKPYFLLE